ncbi:DUF5313 family protein [Williamsia phyllosphaerae]|uniref:DUF5313 domain-containing protein n=1 Tax=Williamsia phyllosphaerae TaxID=885042 RepID=A0ABQ1URZ3_9NOCA|nr:DUF5313 family protein [Williamsia phyllosphaerae]GGF25388.1 hypothetical protein GCM10007298_21600 [Williamsia phyllosphaerae]
MSSQSRTRPTPVGFLRYLGGRPLPESMREWVLHDVVGPGHTRRYITRGVLPLLPILIAFSFIPTPLIYRVCMIAILLIPLVYFQIALTPFYRRHLLLTNGLDPDLISERKQRRKEATKADYDAIYGDREHP